MGSIALLFAPLVFLSLRTFARNRRLVHYSVRTGVKPLTHSFCPLASPMRQFAPRACSSVDRAPASGAGGRKFESCQAH